ncbi:MAG: hypothetical protein IJI52_00145 [Solobacterium sp.]|nr:hypothetical protein [Solobacterium sp.]
MKVIGLDTGTTTISGVLLDDGVVIDTCTLPNDAKTYTIAYALQDAERILSLCEEILERLHAGTADAIALTGQMHGIVYVDDVGKACGSAVSWQDERGSLPWQDGLSFSAYMSRRTGYHLATGYGLVTLYHDLQTGMVPDRAVKITTIPDYVAMRLADSRSPLVHITMAQSMGLYREETKDFDREAFRILGIDEKYLPEVCDEIRTVGLYCGKVPVYCALGDNQASVYGACAGVSEALLNIGTGSQISLICDAYVKVPGLDTRPYVDGKYILSGSSLCGGSAYDVLASLVQDILQRYDCPVPEQLVRDLDAAALEAGSAAGITVDTRFRGSRAEPELTGMITGINTENLTPGTLAYGFAEGVVRELHDFWQLMPAAETVRDLSVSGNAVRSSELYRKCIRTWFPDMNIHVAEQKEEAAYGAARYAGKIRQDPDGR